MADNIKTYTQETIKDTPFPVEANQSVSTEESTGSSTKIYTPTTIQGQAMPKPPIAVELMSTTLNTQSRKIQGSFEFTPSGAIQVGKYENGVSGDIKISPTGIVARDLAGNTTFAIDGDTGNATFKGEVRSGSILTGGVIIQDDSGQTVIDGTGLVSSSTFPNFNQIVPSDSVGNSIQSLTAETTYTTVSDGSNPCSTTVTVPRATKIFISGRADLYFYQSGTGGYGAVGRLAIKLNGSVVDQSFFSGDRFAAPAVQTPTGYGFTVNTITLNYIGSLVAGANTIELQLYKNSSAGTNTSLEVVGYTFNYFLLGT